jgi:hypothetical protein
LFAASAVPWYYPASPARASRTDPDKIRLARGLRRCVDDAGSETGFPLVPEKLKSVHDYRPGANEERALCKVHSKPTDRFRTIAHLIFRGGDLAGVGGLKHMACGHGCFGCLVLRYS